MTLLSPTVRHALLNAVSDPAVVGSMGSAVLTYPTDKASSAINVARCTLSFATRLTTEFEKAGRPLSFMPNWCRYLAKNRGASLVVASLFTLSSAVSPLAKAIQGVVPDDGSSPLVKGLTLSAFGVSHLMFGISASMEKSKLKPVFNAVATTAVSTGFCVLSAPDAPLPLCLLFAASAVMAVKLSFSRNSKSHAGWQPDLTNTVGCLIEAGREFMRSQPVEGAANLFYAANMWSLDALKKHGGVVEAVRSVFSKKPQDAGPRPT